MSRILVVEDDPHILRVISLWLNKQGHQVSEARNGLSGVEQYAVVQPEVLVTDVNMPGLDGIGLLERIADHPWQPRGVVVLTNRWDHQQIGESLKHRNVTVVPKPFSPTLLAGLIQRIVSGEGETAGNPRGEANAAPFPADAS